MRKQTCAFLSVLTATAVFACVTTSGTTSSVEADTADDLMPEATSSSVAFASCFDGGVCTKELPLSGGVTCQLRARAFDTGLCVVETVRRPASMAEAREMPTTLPCGAQRSVCEQPFLCDCRDAQPAKPCTRAAPLTLEVTAPDGSRCEAIVSPPDHGSCDVTRTITRAGDKKSVTARIRLQEEERICGEQVRCECSSFVSVLPPPVPASDAGRPSEDAGEPSGPTQGGGSTK